jgi:hypothetical protein
VVVVGACLLVASSAAADRFYAGDFQGKRDSIVLIDRGPSEVEQAVFRTRYARCKKDGEPKKTRSTLGELNDFPIRAEEFRVDKRIEGPSTGLKPPRYGVRTFLRGEFSQQTADVELRVRYFLRRQGVTRCRSGKQIGSLERISRSRYEDLLASELPTFDPKP